MFRLLCGHRYFEGKRERLGLVVEFVRSTEKKTRGAKGEYPFLPPPVYRALEGLRQDPSRAP